MFGFVVAPTFGFQSRTRMIELFVAVGQHAPQYAPVRVDCVNHPGCTCTPSYAPCFGSG